MSLPTFIKATASLAALIGLLGITACGTQKTDSSTTGDQLQGNVSVFAAASMNAAGAELEKAFEAENPGVDISFNYAGSSKLVQQMQEGASPDLLITADQKNMDQALASLPDLAGESSTVIATNKLVLATAAGNPANINSLGDLAQDRVTVAICAAEVPCGTLAHQALKEHGITLAHATEEQNVSEVSTKLATGAVDAGFIYTTDAASLEKTQQITQIQLDGIERNVYPLATTKTGHHQPAATAFAHWLTQDTAQTILTTYGFGTEK